MVADIDIVPVGREDNERSWQSATGDDRTASPIASDSASSATGGSGC